MEVAGAVAIPPNNKIWIKKRSPFEAIQRAYCHLTQPEDTMTKPLLHIEGFAVLLLCVYVYAQQPFSWLMFFLLLLVPDIGMLGYTINNRIGSQVYNLFHTYTVPIVLMVFGILISDTLLAIALIWTAHIGMDRMIGYGLKYPTEFKDSHLQRV